MITSKKNKNFESLFLITSTQNKICDQVHPWQLEPPLRAPSFLPEIHALPCSYGVGMVLSSSLFIPCLSVCLFWNVGLTWFVHPLVHLYCMLACCKSCTSLGLGVRKGVRGGGRGRGGLLIR
jgi:hypothetical protein